ncbi:hypothetical protein P0136_02925 [Lentisphaerota bacterium ZTH]|nr:hypothetical protein JYG24_05935 [Lentisphaerota bacterium]WET06955.1 hypothetical protein P0136_02925 [Lentisphaerota bacterium ZTH]
MKKSLSVVFILIVVLMSSFSLKADVKCFQCGRTVPNWQTYAVDSNEVQFRKMFREHLKNYIEVTHQIFLKENNLNIDKFIDFYLTPLGDGDETNPYSSKVNKLHPETEEEIQKKPLPKSMEYFLSYDNISPQFKGTLSDLEFCEFYGFKHKFLPEGERELVCDKCDRGFIDMMEARTMTPRNIQPLLKFNQIVDKSDIVILLLNTKNMLRTENLLLEYFKLYHTKKVVLGLGVCDDEIDFYSRNLKEIKVLLEQAFNKWYDINNSSDSKDQFNYDFSNETALIAEYMLPGMNLKKFKTYHPERKNVTKARLIRFLEGRCKNIFWFGAENALAYIGAIGANYEQIATKHYGFLKLACDELSIKVSNIDQVMNNKEEIRNKLYFGYNGSEVGRTETAKRVATYFAAINGKRNSRNRIPFIIAIDVDYGMLRVDQKFQNSLDSNEKNKLVQNLVRKELEKLNLTDINIITILANNSGGRPAIFSKGKNPILDKFCLDYVMFFRGY